MRIFISWSGEVSQKIALLLHSWLPTVIQEIEPFVSSQDIAKGTRGLDTIGQQLAETDFGLLVLTADNVGAPWVNFEAGALSKSLHQSHVIPILCGIREIDIQNSPLRQFQHAAVSQDEFWKVTLDINRRCERPLDESRLRKTFETWWPSFDEAYRSIELASPSERTKTAKGDNIGRIEEALNTLMADMSGLKREMSRQHALIKSLPPAGSQVHFPILSRSGSIPQPQVLPTSTVLGSLFKDPDPHRAVVDALIKGRGTEEDDSVG